MRRALPLAAVALVLVVATGCGPAGTLAPPSASPVVSDSTTPSAAPTAPPTAEPTPTVDQAPASVAPPVTQPPSVQLPTPASPAMVPIPVEGAQAVAGQRFDHAVVCSPPILILFDDAAQDATDPLDSVGPPVWCNDGLALVLAMGVAGESANPIGIVEADIDPPLVLRVAAGQRFGADAVARLAEATGNATVTVSVECTQWGEEYRLDAETLQCNPDLWGAMTFERPATVDQVLTSWSCRAATPATSNCAQRNCNRTPMPDMSG